MTWYCQQHFFVGTGSSVVAFVAAETAACVVVVVGYIHGVVGFEVVYHVNQTDHRLVLFKRILIITNIL
jgi:hypothetical protein